MDSVKNRLKSIFFSLARRVVTKSDPDYNPDTGWTEGEKGRAHMQQRNV